MTCWLGDSQVSLHTKAAVGIPYLAPPPSWPWQIHLRLASAGNSFSSGEGFRGKKDRRDFRVGFSWRGLVTWDVRVGFRVLFQVSQAGFGGL